MKYVEPKKKITRKIAVSTEEVKIVSYKKKEKSKDCLSSAAV